MPSINTKQYDGFKPMYTPYEAEVCGAHVDIEFPSTAFAANDLIRLATIQAGIRIADYKVVMPDIDTGAGFTWSIGELNAAGTDLAVVWASGVTVGQTSGVHRPTSGTHFESDSTVDRRIAIKVTGAAAGYAGASKRGIAVFDLQV